MKTTIVAGMAAASMLTAATVQAVTLGKVGDTTFSIGGYVKLDAMMTTFSDGTRPAQDLSRDFYIPSLTPAGGNDENTVFDMHAKQTRINFKSVSAIGGHKLKTFIEFDFLAAAGGNERVTNSYSPRMRHAFFEYDNWLFGQTWSTFQNVGSLPETVDFIGNTDAGIFVRQAQIRYTSGNLQFALENPETTVTPNGGGDRIVTDDNELPDFVLRYNHKKGDLSLAAAALARQLTYNNGTTIDDSVTSFAISVTGKMMLDKDDIRFGLNTGSGMGRYIGLNVVNGAVIDGSGSLEAIDSTGAFISFRHVIDEHWRTNIVYSTISVDNNVALTGGGVTDKASSLRLNVFNSPIPKLSLGAELALANRETAGGADGDMTRIQFTAKLAF